MQWWSDFQTWLTAADTRPFLFESAVVLVAIVVSGLIAAWIARGTVSGLLARTDRQQKAAAIAALVDAATEASVWNSLTPAEQVLSDRAVGQADIQVRLLPIKSAGLAANWASHQLAELKRNSATFGYQLDPAIAEFRDRLIEWQNKPRRAKRIFQGDLERWRFDQAQPEQQLIEGQETWVAQQHHQRHASTTVLPRATEPAANTVAYAPPAATVAQPAVQPTVAQTTEASLSTPASLVATPEERAAFSRPLDADSNA